MEYTQEELRVKGEIINFSGQVFFVYVQTNAMVIASGSDNMSLRHCPRHIYIYFFGEHRMKE